MILSIDASLPQFSWCLQSEEQIIAQDSKPLKHYENLPNYLQEIFEEQGISPQNIQHLSVIKGPGNYTGLRASLALIRTWHLLFSTPVMCKNRLETMLYHLCQHKNEEIAVAQAVRMDEYFMLKGKKTDQGFTITQALQKIQGTDWEAYLGNTPVFGDVPQGKQLSRKIPQWTHLAPVLAQWTLAAPSHTPLSELVPFYTRAAVQNK